MISTGSRKLDNKFIWPFLILITVMLLFVYYQGWTSALTAPFAIGPEGASMWAALQLASNLNAYPQENLNTAPYILNTYPPVYPALVAWLFKISGPVFPLMRMVSMAAFILLLLVSFRIFTLTGLSKTSRVVALATLMAFSTMWAHSFKARPDILSLMFLVLAVEQYMVLARRTKTDNIFRFPRLIVIATLCMAAGLTKQSALVVIPAIAGALIVGRQWRLALVFMASAVSLTVASECLINYATAGGFFRHMDFAAQAPFRWHALSQHITWLGSDLWLLMLTPLLIFIAFLGYLRNNEEHFNPYRHYFSAFILACILFVASIADGVWSMGLESGSTDETLVCLFACAWLCGFACDFIRRKYLTFLFLTFAVSGYVMFNISNSIYNGLSKMQAAEEKLALTRLNSNRILCEDPGIALLNNAEPEFVDLPGFMAIWRNNPALMQTKLSEIESKIAKKEYGALIINSRDGCLIDPPHYWNPGFIRVIKKNYKPQIELFEEDRTKDLYLPRP